MKRIEELIRTTISLSLLTLISCWGYFPVSYLSFSVMRFYYSYTHPVFHHIAILLAKAARTSEVLFIIHQHIYLVLIRALIYKQRILTFNAVTKTVYIRKLLSWTSGYIPWSSKKCKWFQFVSFITKLIEPILKKQKYYNCFPTRQGTTCAKAQVILKRLRG